MIKHFHYGSRRELVSAGTWSDLNDGRTGYRVVFEFGSWPSETWYSGSLTSPCVIFLISSMITKAPDRSVGVQDSWPGGIAVT